MKKQHDRMRPKRFKKRYAVIGIILLLLAAVPLTAYGVFYSYYSKMNIQPVESDYTIKTDTLGDSENADNSGQDAADDVSGLIDDDIDPELEDSPEEEIQSYEDYLEENAAAQEEALLNSLSEDAEELPYDSDNVYNILLIGTDARYTNQSSRSDSIIIVSINRNTKKIVMTSVMRDIYCTIPGVGNNRINAAYAYGGTSLLIDSIEYNFGIHIDDYVTINFYGFMDAVDAIGGVEMEVSAEEITVMNIYITDLNYLLGLDADADLLTKEQAGTLLLNGKYALAYSRVRYVGNADFERTSRQRNVLAAVIKKAKSLFELNNLMNAVLPCVTTNLTQGEVLSLLLHAGEYLGYEVNSYRIPYDGSWWNLNVRGMAVLGIDFTENRDYWYEKVYEN